MYFLTLMIFFSLCDFVAVLFMAYMHCDIIFNLLCCQVLTILQEVFPAVKAAEMAVKFRPLWWEGWRTLGRAQLNLGEVDLVSVSGNALKTSCEGRAARKCK